MILIAYSNSTRAEWALVKDGREVCRAVTPGLNPFFLSRREISHIIRLDLPEAFFKSKIRKVRFYGSGCATPEKIKIVESSLVAQFHTEVEVSTDLLGAARGLLGRNAGIACILSTGSNSCLYDGENIVNNVTPGGFILGDEGSNAYLGKRLLSDILKGITPKSVITAFYARFETSKEEILDKVYSHAQTNILLSQYSEFLHENIHDQYCHDLVYESIMDFFRRSISQYDYKTYPLTFVGRTCCAYATVLYAVASEFGARIEKIEPSSLPGLIAYHRDD